MSAKYRLLSIFTVLIFVVGNLHGAVFYVTEGGSGSGASWGLSANLQSALSFVTSGDEIWVAGGNYIPGTSESDTFTIPEGVSVLGGFNGTETMESERDWVLNPTKLSGEIQFDANLSNNTDVILTVSGNFIRVSGFIIEDGHGSNGSGIYAYQYKGLTFEDLIFRNNYASSSGGGAYIYNQNGTDTPNVVSNCIFENNEAAFDAGGLNFFSGDNGSNPDEIFNCIFINNKASRAGSGLLYSSSGNANNLTFIGNEDIDGPGGDDAAQLVISGTSSTGYIRNSIFLNAVNTSDLGTWKVTGNPSTTIEYCHLEDTTVTNVGTGDISTVVLGTGTVQSTTDLIDIAMPAGSDNIWFTEDDGLNLASSANAIDAGVLQAPNTDKDILGNARDASPDLGAYEYSGNTLVGPALVNDSSFTPSANLITSAGPDPVLIWFMDTENTGYTGNITDIRFNVYGADPNTELAGALVYDLSTTSLVSNSPTFGGNYIDFNGLNWPLSSAANSQLELKVTTASSFSSDNIQFELQPVAIALSDNATVSGTPIDSGVIVLDNNSQPSVVHVMPYAMGDGSGSDWANSSNLHDALASDAPGDEIWLAAGNYFPSSNNNRSEYFLLDQNEVTLLGGFNGTETSSDQRDWVANPTVLTGDIGTYDLNTDNSYTIMYIGMSNILIDGFIFERGNSDDASGVQSEGGAIHLNSAAYGVVISNSIFRQNIARIGGAINQPNGVTAGPLVIHNCVFEYNTGLQETGAIDSEGWIEITNTIFAFNTVNTSQGGALTITNSSQTNSFIQHCLFYANSAVGLGGAVFSNQNTLSITNSIFWDNDSSNGFEINQFSGVITTSNSVIQGADSGAWPGSSWGSDGGNNIDALPLFSDNLNIAGADNIWFTDDDGFTLQSGSPAVDRGTLISSANVGLLGLVRNASPNAGPYETLSAIFTEVTLEPYSSFTVPANIQRGSIDNVVMMWEVSGGSNIETIDGFVIGAYSDTSDLLQAEIYEISGSPTLIYNGTAATGNLNANIEFSGNPVTLSPGNTLLFELKVDVANSTNSDNVGVVLDPNDVSLVGGNNVTGSLVHFGPIPLIDSGNTGSAGNVYLVSSPNGVDSNLNPGDVDRPVLNFRLDTMTEGVSGTLEYVEFSIVTGNATIGVDFNEYHLYENTDGFIGSSNTVVNGNIIFSGISYSFDSSRDFDFDLTVDTEATFTNSSFQPEVYASDIVINGGAVSVLGGPISDPAVTLNGVSNNFPSFDQSNPINVVMDQDGNPTPFSIVITATDPDSDPLTWSLGFPATNGTATVSSSGNVDYSPSPGFTGNDSFGVDINDGNGGSAGMTVNVTVNPVSSANLIFQPSSSFNSPADVASGNLETILSFDVYSNSNATFDSISVDLLSGNASDLVNTQLWSTSFGDYFLSFGSLVGGNLFFSGNGTTFIPSNNLNFEIRVNVPSNNTGSDFELGIDPSDPMKVSFDGGALTTDGAFFSTGAIGIINGGDSTTSAQALAGGADLSLVLYKGDLWTFGRNEINQLARSGNNLTPTIASLGVDLVDMAAGTSHGIGITTDGDVLTWGSNDFGQGKNNDGSTFIDSSVGNVVLVAAGAYSSYAVNDAGELYVKGRNNMGQLGLGDTTQRTIWVKNNNLPAGNIQQISAGVEHVLILIDGYIYGFGSNGFRQLGFDASTSIVTTPTSVTGGNNHVLIQAGGFNSLYSDNSNNLYGMGKNTDGQLGLGNNSATVGSSMISLPGNIGQILELAVGFEHSIVVVEDAGDTRVIVSGSNEYGQLDINGVTDMNIFTNTDNAITNVEEIAATHYGTLILNRDGLLLGTGKVDGDTRPTLQIIDDLSN